MASPASRAGAPLSERQSEILRLIALGKSNKEIARQLGLATGTVKQHVHALFRKLGVRNRTMAVLRGAGESASAVTAGGARTNAGAADDLAYIRRLVTVVVVQPRPDPVFGRREAAEQEKRIGALLARVERLAFAFDARAESVPAGGIAAWFGRPFAHGDDAERAVAFVRLLAAESVEAFGGVPYAAGIGTVAEVLGEGGRSSIAHRTFRVATLLASLAEPGAPLACELTSRLALRPGDFVGPVPAGAVVPVLAGASVVGPAPTPSAAVAKQWGGLPFVAELRANVRGHSQWLGIESWPPQAGTRLIDAIGACLAAGGTPVRRLWMPTPLSAGSVEERLISQLAEAGVSAALGPPGGRLAAALAGLASAGPAVLLAHGIDALPILKGVLGEPGIEALRIRPLIIVAGAMHRSGAPQTVVRLLGSHPGASPFVRVLRMEVPPADAGAPEGIRPDVQAVLDSVSSEARAVARYASQPGAVEIATIARALGMSPESVTVRCRELEGWGLVALREGRLDFRDEATAAAIRASLE